MQKETKNHSAPIHFNSVKIAANKNRKAILKKIDKVIQSGVFLEGEENKKLSQNLRKFLGSGFIVTVDSGHSALKLAIDSLLLKPTDEVIFPANSYPTAFPIAQSGAKLIPVDVDDNGQISAFEIKKKLSRNTKAIVIVHLYGIVNVKEIKETIKNKKIKIIVDAAQAFGSKYKGKYAGTWGDIGCFSFYPTKNLGALGDGGAIWTKDKKTYNRLLQSKQYGEKKRYKSNFVAGHHRLPEIQAAVLNLYLSKIKGEISTRKKIFNYYKKSFSKSDLKENFRMLESFEDSEPVIHLITFEAKNRNKLQKFLKKRGIPTFIHYPTPVHLTPAFSSLGFKKGDFPISERLSENIISLPFHSHLTKKEIDYIVKSVSDFYEKKRKTNS